MRQQTLAETLRAYFEADAAYAVARHSMQHTIASEWTDDERAQYLRGYDDANDERDPYIEKMERKNEALEDRVRELEAQIAAQPAQALGEEG